MEKKICNVCNEEKDISSFYFRKENNKYRGNCKKCKPLNSKESISQKLLSPTKVCKHCNEEKPVSEYNKAGGGKWLQPYCRPCDSERKKAYALANKENVMNARKTYYDANKEVIKEKRKNEYHDNREKILAYHKEYSKKNKELISKKGKEYRKNNSEYVKERDRQARINAHPQRLSREKEYRKNKTTEQKEKDKQLKKEWEIKNRDVLKDRYLDRKRKNRRDWCNMKSATDIGFKILKNLRSRTRWALKSNGAKKVAKTEVLLGCTIEYFKEYFSSLFTEGMTWERFMNGEIHIDHIKPCKLFDLTNEDEQRACFHYSNLQPLWEADNLKKSDNYLQKVA